MTHQSINKMKLGYLLTSIIYSTILYNTYKKRKRIFDESFILGAMTHARILVADSDDDDEAM